MVSTTIKGTPNVSPTSFLLSGAAHAHRRGSRDDGAVRKGTLPRSGQVRVPDPRLYLLVRGLKKLPPQQNLWVRFGSGSCPRLCNKASFATIAVRIPHFMSLFPTLTDVCGIPTPGHVEGPSLCTQLGDPGAPWDRPALATYRFGNHAARPEGWRASATRTAARSGTKRRPIRTVRVDRPGPGPAAPGGEGGAGEVLPSGRITPRSATTEPPAPLPPPPSRGPKLTGVRGVSLVMILSDLRERCRFTA